MDAVRLLPSSSSKRASRSACPFAASILLYSFRLFFLRGTPVTETVAEGPLLNLSS